MKNVAKYNLFKGLSTVTTVGTPIATLLAFSTFFVERPSRTISATAVFAILIVLLFFKDKIVENWKTPSAFVIALCMLIFIIIVEHILLPMKYVCIATVFASIVDELTFKRAYKNIELKLPERVKIYKHFGFIFTTSKNIENEI